MSEDGRPGLVAVRDARDRAIQALSEHFANGHLDVDEFERRVELAHRVESVADLEPLLKDLPTQSTALTKPSAKELRPAEPAAPRRNRQTVVAIMGGAERSGRWIPPRRLNIFTLMGGAELDFREVMLPPGVTEIFVIAVMGGISVIVPPDLAVVTNGIAIMGGFEHVERAPATFDPGAPLLKVSGFAMMGGVDITMRLPGETEREARRRRKRERKLQLESHKP